MLHKIFFKSKSSCNTYIGVFLTTFMLFNACNLGCAKSSDSLYLGNEDFNLIKKGIDEWKIENDFDYYYLERKKELLATYHLYHLPQTDSELLLDKLIDSDIDGCVDNGRILNTEDCKKVNGMLTDNFIK